jgi:hypothetical protein
MIVPSLDMLANVRLNQWIAHLPEDHPLAQQHHALLGATAPNNLDFMVSSSPRCLQRALLTRGYDSLHDIFRMTNLMLLSAGWSKSTDTLDAALCSLGVFSVLRRTATPVTAGTFSKWIVLAVLARIKGLTVGVRALF